MIKLLKIRHFDVLQSESNLSWGDAVAWQEEANAESVGGFSDWVLPDVDTLKSLCRVNDGNGGWFWSSSPVGSSRDRAWTVGFSLKKNFVFISAIKGARGDTRRACSRVRLVRVGQMLDIGQAGQLESMRQAGIQASNVC